MANKKILKGNQEKIYINDDISTPLLGDLFLLLDVATAVSLKKSIILYKNGETTQVNDDI